MDTELGMRGLSPTWPRLLVVTPNYDMLIESACSKANYPYINFEHYADEVIAHCKSEKQAQWLKAVIKRRMGGV